MPELTQRITASTTGHDSVWIPIGSPGSGTIPEIAHSTARAVSRGLALSSPFYNRLLDAIVDSVFTPGTGVSFVSEVSPAIKTTIDWLWEDGPSAFSVHGRSLIKTLLVDGELILKPDVNEADGRLTLEVLDPAMVAEVEGGRGLKAIKQFVYETGQLDRPVKLRVIQWELVNLSELSGDAFFFRLFPPGYTATSLRGVPLLISCLDHISAITEFTYRRISILSRLATFYWDVMLEGMSQEQIDVWLESPRAAPPDGGEIFAHNERATWKVIVPEVSDISSEGKFWMDLIAGAVGLTPEFMGRSQGRDITTEAIYTALVRLSALQDEILSTLRFITLYALKQAAKRDPATRTIPRFKITATTPGSRSLQRAAMSVRTLMDTLSRAIEQGLLSADEAKGILRDSLTQLKFLESSEP